MRNMKIQQKRRHKSKTHEKHVKMRTKNKNAKHDMFLKVGEEGIFNQRTPKTNQQTTKDKLKKNKKMARHMIKWKNEKNART